MSFILIDYRDKLPRANWSIGYRSGNPTSMTLHYNGPPVTIDPYRQLVIDAEYHMGPYLNADGLQYPIVIMPDGTILQTRDLNAILWHCGSWIGNIYSVGVHMPLGGNQNATPEQWASAEAVFAWGMREWGFGRNRIYGHFEWPRSDGKPQSACPGPHLKRRLLAWRNNRIGRYEVISPDGANVRTAPTTQAGIAMVYPVGYQFDVYGITRGQSIAGIDEWLNSGDKRGFVHPTTSRKIA